MVNRPPRFPEFDYKGFNRYFLTVCVNQRAPIFLDVELGRCLAGHFLPIAATFDFEVIAYCIMPDHFHILVGGNTDDCELMPFMHRWKQVTGYWWKHELRHQTRLWQKGYYDRILRDSDSTEGVMRYILENPVRAGLVEDVRDYPLIGATHYDIDVLLESAISWRPSWK